MIGQSIDYMGRKRIKATVWDCVQAPYYTVSNTAPLLRLYLGGVLVFLHRTMSPLVMMGRAPGLTQDYLESSCYRSPFIKLQFRAAAAAAKTLQLCPTLCDPIDGSPSCSPVPEILQARTLEWVAISFSNAWKWKVKVKSLSRVWLLVTPWTAAYQAPPSMGFSRQEYWSRVPLPSPALFTGCLISGRVEQSYC